MNDWLPGTSCRAQLPSPGGKKALRIKAVRCKDGGTSIFCQMDSWTLKAIFKSLGERFPSLFGVGGDSLFYVVSSTSTRGQQLLAA